MSRDNSKHDPRGTDAGESRCRIYTLTSSQWRYYSKEPLMLSLLSANERLRYDAFAFEHHREEYLFAHFFMRLVLAQELGIPPQQLMYSKGVHGRPELLGVEGRPRLRFNLSHSADVVVVAVTDALDCGIDTEFLRSDADFAVLAPRIFTDAERSAWEGMEPDEARKFFYDTWTLKEAYLKAIGMGLQIPPSGISTSVVPKGDRFVCRIDCQVTGQSEWCHHRWSPTPSQTAVALVRSDKPVRFIKIDGGSYFP